MCIGNVLRLVLDLVRDICNQEVPSLPDHHGDVADAVHHKFPPLFSMGNEMEPLFPHLPVEKHHPRAGLILYAPEDLGAGLLLQWVEGGLHGQGEGSKQVPPGGARHVLEIEETFILNVPIWWPGVSQDSILWKTTRAVPPSFSLATARCSWLEQFPASHVTGQICTMFCLECSCEFSIHTQLLLLRAYSKSCSIYTMKPTQRWSSSKSDSGPVKMTVLSRGRPQLRSKSDPGPAEELPSCIVQRLPSPLLLDVRAMCEAATEKD